MKYIRYQNNKIQKNKFGIDKFDHANMFTMLLHNFLPKIGLQVGNINKYVIIVHLICINHNNIINKPFSAEKRL